MTRILNMKHGQATREMTRQSLRALNGHGDPGRFGRMFPTLDPLVVGDDKLFTLAKAMRDTAPEDGKDNPNIPAGFTYLGQFVDHDITLDLTPLDLQKADPLATQNFRSPALDLDSLYGPGPVLAPFMYQRDAKGRKLPKLLVGRTDPSPDGTGTDLPEFFADLPRTGAGRAVIGDERNDENLLVAQTHLAFLKFHNAVVDWVQQRHPALDRDALFEEAQRLTRWHYQWIVLYDFVEKLTEKGLIDRIRREGRRFYRFKTRPYMPAEFSAAAYRLGHSMIRESYSHNRVFRPGGPLGGTTGTLKLLFFFSGKSGAIIGDLAATADRADFPNGPGPQRVLPSNWIVDWRRFFDFKTPPGADFLLNPSRRLDPLIVPELHGLPGEEGRFAVLPFRNLRRGVQLELPSGQHVARAMGITPMAPEDFVDGSPDGQAADDTGLNDTTPLWYYILKEASVIGKGKRLGPVGSLIIAETFLGIVHGDQNSFLWQRENWKPELPSAEPGTFTMVDLLNFVGDINPLG
ncbi:MAG: heme peroxidase [Rhizobiaceae bacterium]|nr:heme peroxidase [Rhizobiaceae bacterium]